MEFISSKCALRSARGRIQNATYCEASGYKTDDRLQNKATSRIRFDLFLSNFHNSTSRYVAIHRIVGCSNFFEFNSERREEQSVEGKNSLFSLALMHQKKTDLVV